MERRYKFDVFPSRNQSQLMNYQFPIHLTVTHLSEPGIIEVDPLVHLAVVREGAVVSAVVRYEGSQLILVDISSVREDMVKQLQEMGKTFHMTVEHVWRQMWIIFFRIKKK